MSEQIRLLPGLGPDDLIATAKERWKPIKTFCLFSGGGDSMTVAHRCRDHYDALFFIDTGTGVHEEPDNLKVIEHVRRCADELEKPLYVLGAGDAFERIVLGGNVLSRGEHEGEAEPAQGFPGPGMHGKCYTRLKERQIERMLRLAKVGHPRSASVLFLSGIRRDESRRRKNREPLTEHGSAKFCNPLIDWTNAEMARYKAEHGIKPSDISALLHMSGECLCGAYASADDERAMLETFFPATFDRIRELEQKAEAQGLRWCRWGGYDLAGNRSTSESEEQTGPLCESCDLRQLSLDAA